MLVVTVEKVKNWQKKYNSYGKDKNGRYVPLDIRDDYIAAGKYKKAVRDEVKRKSNLRDINKSSGGVSTKYDLVNKAAEKGISQGKVEEYMHGERTRDKAINKRGEKYQILREAVDILYEKAVMCEDASEAEGYIEKAEALESLLEE